MPDMTRCANCLCIIDEEDDLCSVCEDIEEAREMAADDCPIGGVALHEVPYYSRDEFYEMIKEDPDSYSGLVDPDELEMILIATIMNMDRKFMAILKENKELKEKLTRLSVM